MSVGAEHPPWIFAAIAFTGEGRVSRQGGVHAGTDPVFGNFDGATPMNDEKKAVDDSGKQALGTGAGAAAGAVTGAAVGAPGGPIGMAIGAIAGGVIGAGAGESMAETANVEDYRAHFQRDYSGAAYYRPGTTWDDYEPAYQFAFDHFEEYHGRPWAEVEPDLREEWQVERAVRPERSEWAEARPAISAGWDYLREGARKVAAGKR